MTVKEIGLVIVHDHQPFLSLPGLNALILPYSRVICSLPVRSCCGY